ncbi:MAG: hydroxymethylbilane synthase [Crocinitomicaceae bacterium]
MQHIVIGSRGSDLALWQANHVKSQLENIGCSVEIKIIVTQGDAIQHLSFDKLEGKGFFTKEIEKELLEGTIDLAVHSHKDLETNPPKGLVIAAVSERENPADLLLIAKSAVDTSKEWKLKEGAIVGTSSARRKSQVMRFRNDVEIKDLRGNVPTRIDKLRKGGYDAILLAKAGVDRLKIDLSEFEVIEMNPTSFVPAPAQGVLGLQVREGDQAIFDTIHKLNNSTIENRIGIERKVLNLMEGGCQLPLGVYCDENNSVFVSYSDDWTTGSVWQKYDANSQDNIAEFIVKDITAKTQNA